MNPGILKRLIYSNNKIWKFLNVFQAKYQLTVLKFYKDKKIIDLIKTISKEVDFGLRPFEAYTVYTIAKTQSTLDGDMAEVGVWKGGSARLICEAKGSINLHLFDTFEGLPEVSDKDMCFSQIKLLHKGDFKNTNIETVKDYLSRYDGVHYYKGEFHNTSNAIKDKKFSFVHLDVDLYQSTLECLNIFYPRLVPGGIIISHDYSNLDGVRKAFEDFFKGIRNPVIEINETQCMVIKY